MAKGVINKNRTGTWIRSESRSDRTEKTTLELTSELLVGYIREDSNTTIDSLSEWVVLNQGVGKLDFDESIHPAQIISDFLEKRYNIDCPEDRNAYSAYPTVPLKSFSGHLEYVRRRNPAPQDFLEYFLGDEKYNSLKCRLESRSQTDKDSVRELIDTEVVAATTAPIHNLEIS